MVRQLIGDSLRHLADGFRVDGFVFINAETLTQGNLWLRKLVLCISD